MNVEDDMRSKLIITFIALCLGLGFSQVSFAVCGGGPTVFTCNTAPPNPDPNGVQQAANDADLTITVLGGAGIDTIIANGGNGGDAIEYGAGSSEITIRNANISAEDDGINAFNNNGRATISIENSTMFTQDDVIDFGDADGNILNITNSGLRTGVTGERVLNSGQGDDTVNIFGSTLTTIDGEVLTMRRGRDNVTLEHTLLRNLGFSNESVELGDDDDTLTLLNGVVFERPEGGREFINCSDGNDAIVFAMNVPEKFLADAKQRLAKATVPSGSITINGLFYDWEECELLIDELKAGPTGRIRPIPTLSEWGIIVMASIIGIVGVMFVMRKWNKVRA